MSGIPGNSSGGGIYPEKISMGTDRWSFRRQKYTGEFPEESVRGSFRRNVPENARRVSWEEFVRGRWQGPG